MHRRTGRVAKVRMLNAPDDTTPPHRYTPGSTPPPTAHQLNSRLSTARDSVTGQKPTFPASYRAQQHLAAEQALLASRNARQAAARLPRAPPVESSAGPLSSRGRCV